MSLIAVSVKWTRLYDNPSGGMYRGDGLWFDTDTRQISTTSVQRGRVTLDPVPTEVQLKAGDYIYEACGVNFLRQTWHYDGNGGTLVTDEPNSPFCGYTPPATCNLGTLTVKQTPTATGATLLAEFTGMVNGTGYYSLDGGPEQTSPQFLRVLAGLHKLKLRDDGLAGCEREVDVLIKGASTTPVLPAAPAGPSAGIDFVRQPLWYPMTGQPVGAQVELELWAESAHGAADYGLVLTLSKRVDTAGRVDFQLHTLLYSLLRAFVPPVAPTGTILCTTNLVNYYVRTTVTPLDPAQLPVHAVSPLRTALRGGLPAEWQPTDYFAFRLSSFPAPVFLSWQPTGAGAYAASKAKHVVSSQPEWLFFPCELGLANAQLRIRRAYYLTENGPATEDFEDLVQPSGSWAQRLLAIPLKPGRSGFGFMSVRVETAAGVVVSQEARYRFVLASSRTRYLLFTNSLGGIDTLRCADRARLDVTLEATATAVERPRRLGDRSPAADQQLSDFSAGRKLKLAIGWRTPAELAWLQELVLAREIWQHVAEQLRPLDWPKRTLGTYSDEPGLRGLSMEFDYAYETTAYAPGTY